jgi:hypothetical protein
MEEWASEGEGKDKEGDAIIGLVIQSYLWRVKGRWTAANNNKVGQTSFSPSRNKNERAMIRRCRRACLGG